MNIWWKGILSLFTFSIHLSTLNRRRYWTKVYKRALLMENQKKDNKIIVFFSLFFFGLVNLIEERSVLDYSYSFPYVQRKFHIFYVFDWGCTSLIRIRFSSHSAFHSLVCRAWNNTFPPDVGVLLFKKLRMKWKRISAEWRIKIGRWQT